MVAMKNTKTKLEKITYGEIHFYYPFKFADNKLSFSEICKRIERSPLLFTDEYQQQVTDSLGYSLAHAFENIKSEFETSNLFPACILKMQDYEKYRSNTPSPTPIDLDNILLEIESENSKIKLNFKNADVELLNRRILRLQTEYETSMEIYGPAFTNCQDRFLLLPLQVELQNGTYTWLYPLLYIFANNMGVLKFELPLLDSNIEPLYTNEYDSLIKSVNNKWKINNYNSETSLSSIKEFYFNNLIKDAKSTLISYLNDIRNIIFVDFDGIPQHMNSIANETAEDIYRIICAPVPSRKTTSYVKDAKEYISTHSCGGHGINYIIKSTGGFLSLIDQTILSSLCLDYHNCNKADILNPFDCYYSLCNDLASILSINIEFSILIALLKKTNESNDYFNKTTSMKQLAEAQKEYNRNMLFISQLQEDCYGSVSEQFELVERMMPHYFKPNITEAKKEAINSLLNQKEQEKNDRFQNYISTGGLLLTLIFGLPSLYESLTIIRGFFSFIPFNIPYLSVLNISIVLWLALNTLVILNICLKKRQSKPKHLMDSTIQPKSDHETP